MEVVSFRDVWTPTSLATAPYLTLRAPTSYNNAFACAFESSLRSDGALNAFTVSIGAHCEPSTKVPVSVEGEGNTQNSKHGDKDGDAKEPVIGLVYRLPRGLLRNDVLHGGSICTGRSCISQRGDEGAYSG